MRERIRFEREIQDLRSGTFPELEKSAPSAGSGTSKKHVVLVAGVDYEDFDHNFSVYCVNRIKRILRKKRGADKDASLVFTLFDVKSGSVKSFEVVGKKRTWVEKSKFIAVTTANYTGKVFNKNPAGVMSITDVYDFVRAQGKSEPESIQELSFFSHGWLGGPILVNSSDNQPAGSLTRDANDKDGRSHKDFVAPNMDGAAQKEFRDAFSKNAFVWVWGCVFTAAPFQVLHRVMKNKKYHSKVKDDELLELEFEPEHTTLFFHEDPVFFPAMRADGTFARKFWRSFKEIKEFLQRMVDATYCKAIARASQRKCFGALPGTYSLYEKTKDLPLMLVPRRKPPYPDDFSRQVNFYAKHLKILLDPESRGYGNYSP